MPRRRFRAPEPEPLDLERALAGRRHVETRRDGAWNVQPQPAASAAKIYTCPGCGGEIEVGVAHVVTWRADGIMGADDDLAGRRHWHTHCWRIRT